MPKFFCSCQKARKHGAIGIFYLIEEWTEAADKAEAEAKFRDKYETCGPPVVIHSEDERKVDA